MMIPVMQVKKYPNRCDCPKRERERAAAVAVFSTMPRVWIARHLLWTVHPGGGGPALTLVALS